MADVIEDDGYFGLTVRLPDGQEIHRELDLYEQFNRLNEIVRMNPVAVDANAAQALHWQKVYDLPAPPSHKCAIALTNAVYAEYAREKKAPADGQMPGSPASTAPTS